MHHIAQQLPVSHNATFVQGALGELDATAKEIQVQTEEIFSAFMLIRYLCFLNLVFFANQMFAFIFLKKIGRSFTFPTIGFFTDLILFITSCFTIYWVNTNIFYGVNVPGISTEERFYRELVNFETNIDTKFEYLFSVMVFCLIYKVLEIVQFSADIGPLFKIVDKMMGDFFNFLILYLIFIFMFAIVGNLNFVFKLKEFAGLFESILTVLDASIGKYNF